MFVCVTPTRTHRLRAERRGSAAPGFDTTGPFMFSLHVSNFWIHFETCLNVISFTLVIKVIQFSWWNGIEVLNARSLFSDNYNGYFYFKLNRCIFGLGYLRAVSSGVDSYCTNPPHTNLHSIQYFFLSNILLLQNQNAAKVCEKGDENGTSRRR